MASITGDLASISVPELFRSIADDNRTGRISFSRPGGGTHEAHVYFRHGEAYHARMVGSGVQLGTRLASAGLVSRQEIEEALWTQKGEGGARRLGEILVDEGLLPREKMEAIVREQIEDTIFEILRWDGGNFAFDPGAESNEDVGIEVSVENLVMEGARRFREWHQITRRVPTLDAVPRFTEEDDGAVEVALTPEEWSFVAALDGHRTVAELAQACGFTDLEAARTVFGLVTAGLLELQLPEGIELPGENADLDAAFDELEEALQEASRERPAVERQGRTLEELVHGSGPAPAPAKKRPGKRAKKEAALKEAESAALDAAVAEPIEAELAEATAAEGAEAQALEAQRLETERLEAERVAEEERFAEAERLEAERVAEEERFAEAESLRAAALFQDGETAPAEADRYAEVWEQRADGPAPSQPQEEEPLPVAQEQGMPADQRPVIKIHDAWGAVSPAASRGAPEAEAPRVIAEEVVNGREGSMARLFAELTGPLDEPLEPFLQQSPEPDPQPEPAPAVGKDGDHAPALAPPRPVDPGVDTSALIRELSAFAMDEEEPSSLDSSWSDPSTRNKAGPEDKGRGLFGRRRR